MLLKIEESQIGGGVSLIELKGRLALGRESQRIESLADELVEDGRVKAILDLSGVDYIDSAGIGILALVAGKLKEAGGKLVAVAPEGRVLHMLVRTQITQIVTVCPSVAEAAAAFGETFPPAAA